MTTIQNFSEELITENSMTKALKELKKTNISDLKKNANFGGWTPWTA